jgi:hypothetical protein
MFRPFLAPKKEDKTSKPEISKTKDTNKINTISLEYIFLNFH